MPYTVQQYLKYNNISDLERRFKLLEPLVRVYKNDLEMVRRAMEDKEWGEAKMKEIQEKLDDLRSDATNIVTAIELLRGGYLDDS